MNINRLFYTLSQLSDEKICNSQIVFIVEIIFSSFYMSNVAFSVAIFVVRKLRLRIDAWHIESELARTAALYLTPSNVNIALKFFKKEAKDLR